MKKLKRIEDKKNELKDKVFTTKDGKRIRLGKDIKTLIVIAIAVIAVILCILFTKIMNSNSHSTSDTANADISYLDRILLGKETKEISNIDKSEDKDTSKLEEFDLIRVIDGDTIEVKRGNNGTPTSVRLLSVNTPESVNPDQALNNEFGKRASEYTTNLLAGTEKVYLSYDKEDTDEYGRTLAYVWISKDANLQSEDDIKAYMVNSILIQNGMAECKIYEPNHKYQEVFEKQEKAAMEQNIGLWSDINYKKLVNKGI